MRTSRYLFLALCIGLLFLTPGRLEGREGAAEMPRRVPEPVVQAQGAAVRRVNAPYFGGDVLFNETAVFWFGKVTPTENAIDVRVGYNSDHLYVHVAVFDRRLWYDADSPSPDDLLAWDAVALYLDTGNEAGSLPDGNDLRLDAQLVWWEPRAPYQAAYRGDGSEWIRTTLPFTTTSFWRGTVPNDDREDDRGWALNYYVPFQELGLSGPPEQGTVWGMAVAVHDRDDENGSPIPDQIWPEAMLPQRPDTWGQIAFGMPIYSPPPAVAGGTATIRHGLDGAVVVDADVGGSGDCGAPAAPDYFSTWGALNYAGKTFLNIQNQVDVADWPCFARYYVTFPLDALPSDRIVISATLTLTQWGNAGEGWDPGPRPSLIQVLTVAEDWQEATLTWNNAPLALENVAAAWADVFPEWPGEPRHWDVSRAVAEAYASGAPLRLALYEADGDYHSGKYFWSSEEWDAARRPTLTVTWGYAAADLTMVARPSSAYWGEPVTYTLRLLGTGNTLYLTNTLPVGTGAPYHFELEGTSVMPAYDSALHRLTWSDTVAASQVATIRYMVTIATMERRVLTNVAVYQEAGGTSGLVRTVIIANPDRAHLPLILSRD